MEISPRERAIRAIERSPDEASWDHIDYTIYVCRQIVRGLQDAEAGNVIDHEEVMREIREWLLSAEH